jgi:hypothetical protein
MDEAPHLHKCFNGCSHRGACIHNWCKCQPGHWGIDCSLNASSANPSTPAVSSKNSRSKNIKPPHLNASSANPSTPAVSPKNSPRPRPRIYVYDLPPRYTSWLAAYRRGDWTRDHWYGADVIFHQQLLRSPHREFDPEQADLFLVPLHLSLGFYSHRYYFKHFTSVAAKPMREAVAYVRRTWPFFDRRNGADHLFIMPQVRIMRSV